MRGEHVRQSTGSEADVGSSPHARGAPAMSAGFWWTTRIIPACAGSTSLAIAATRP